MEPKKALFRLFGKFPKVKTFTQYLKFTTRHNFIKMLTTYALEIVISHNFFVYPQNMLQKYCTNQCLFKHRLKDKCLGTQLYIFTESAPLGRFSHRVPISVCLSVCLSVCSIGCSFFRGLSLALISHDQFQASHWSSLPPSLRNLEFFFIFLFCEPPYKNYKL